MDGDLHESECLRLIWMVPSLETNLKNLEQKENQSEKNRPLLYIVLLYFLNQTAWDNRFQSQCTMS